MSKRSTPDPVDDKSATERPCSDEAPQRVKLFCLLLCESNPFSVELAPNQSVYTLKELVKTEKPNALKDVAARHLRLWKIDEPEEEAMKLEETDMGKELDALDDVAEYWPDGFGGGDVVHILVAKPLVRR